jgi:hypothetical protein
LKRPLTDVLRRGFDNVVANWPLVLIRVAETALLIGITIGALIAVVIPLVVSAHVGGWQNIQANPDAMWETVMTVVAEHWLLLVYLLLIASGVLAVILAIHSAVEAGSARVYLDAERAGSISRTTTRERFEVFAMDRFLAGMREGWWRVFWIYNAAWLVAGLVVLVPLAAGAALIAVIGMNAAALVLGCLILVAMCLLFVVVAIVTNLWVEKAIVIAVDRGLGANEALREARHQIGADFARHAALAIVILGISLVGGAMLSSFSSGFPVHGSSADWQLLFLSPLVLASSILNTVFSAAVASWYLASVAAIQQENPA